MWIGDLCLTDYLLSTAQVWTMRFHAKLHPIFSPNPKR